MNTVNENFSAIGPVDPDLMLKLCRLGFPHGAIAKCFKCDGEWTLTMEQVAARLMKSYPKHCGQRIELVSKAK